LNEVIRVGLEALRDFQEEARTGIMGAKNDAEKGPYLFRFGLGMPLGAWFDELKKRSADLRKGMTMGESDATLDHAMKVILGQGYAVRMQAGPLDPGFVKISPAGEREFHSLNEPLAREEKLRRQLVALDLLYDTLRKEPDRQKAGLALEKLLTDLFNAFELEARKPFRVVGEQIDGSFAMENEVYILEAKWTKDPTDQKELYAFRGKIEGKSPFTRGLFISINGFSEDSVKALVTGKTPTFVLMNGAELKAILEGRVKLPELIRQKARHLAEEGDPYLVLFH
jgi:hypothetical protein